MGAWLVNLDDIIIMNCIRTCIMSKRITVLARPVALKVITHAVRRRNSSWNLEVGGVVYLQPRNTALIELHTLFCRQSPRIFVFNFQ